MGGGWRHWASIRDILQPNLIGIGSPSNRKLGNTRSGKVWGLRPPGSKVAPDGSQLQKALTACHQLT